MQRYFIGLRQFFNGCSSGNNLILVLLSSFVNMVLVDLVKSGKFYKIYERWLGPQGEVPFPMSGDYKTLLELQSWPY